VVAGLVFNGVEHLRHETPLPSALPQLVTLDDTLAVVRQKQGTILLVEGPRITSAALEVILGRVSWVGSRRAVTRFYSAWVGEWVHVVRWCKLLLFLSLSLPAGSPW